MKKKWIIPAIIAVVLVVIVSLIAFFPAMLINGMAKEQVKRLDNSYINSNYQGWNEVTFFDEHHFLLPDTWHIESIDDATYCIYGDDARVIAFVGELGKDAPYRDTDAFCASMFKSVEIVSRTELHEGEHFGNGCNAYRQQRVCKMRSRKNLFMYLHNMSFLLTLINDVQFSSKTTHSTAMRYQSMLLQLPTLIDRATTRMENRLRYYL